MARYIDEKDVYKLVEPTGVARVHCSQIDELPRADVVPKSEVDEIVRQWKEEANCWQNNYITELRANEQIKAEVAREIFEEIESLLGIYTYEDNYGEYISTGLADEFAELKKKYTEEKE